MKYYNPKTSNKYEKVIDQLSKNNNIIIIKQGKEREVVILDRTKYMDKCLSILTTSKFSKLNYDATSKLESKVQETLSKLNRNYLKSLTRTFTQQNLTLVNSMGTQKYTNLHLAT